MFVWSNLADDCCILAPNAPRLLLPSRITYFMRTCRPRYYIFSSWFTCISTAFGAAPASYITVECKNKLPTAKVGLTQFQQEPKSCYLTLLLSCLCLSGSGTFSVALNWVRNAVTSTPSHMLVFTQKLHFRSQIKPLNIIASLGLKTAKPLL